MAVNSLTGLPAEMLFEIYSCLSYGSRLALRLTCRDLYAKIGDPNLNTTNHSHAPTSYPSKLKAYTMADLLEIERWPVYNAAEYRPLQSRQANAGQDFFACFICLRIRSASKFSNAMMKGKRGKLGAGTIAERMRRLCIECGVRTGIYKRKTYIQFGGALGGSGFVCGTCGNFEVMRFRCSMEPAERICGSCINPGLRGYREDDRFEISSDSGDWQDDPFEISLDCGDWRDVLE